jgi:hypothetical protein
VAPYVPRAAADTVLHGVVREYLETFLAAAAARTGGQGLPRFIERELRGFLRCGLLVHGFLRLRCDDCAFERLLPLSCKGRAVCASCGGRRMAEQAANLVQSVLPWVPVRQWVLTVPHRLRYRLAFDHALCRAVIAVFVRAVLGWYRRRARRAGWTDGHSGAVTVIQRFGSGLQVNVHAHALFLDGVFTDAADGTLRFHPASAPTDVEVARLVATIRTRVLRLLRRRGVCLDAADDDAPDPLAETSLALAGITSAAVQGRSALGPRAGARVRQLGGVPGMPWVTSTGPRQAHLDGFDLHANVAVAADNRDGLEQLARYVLRPPIAQERLSRTADGRVLLRLKAEWHDGTTHLVFEPLELLERLAALTPRPRINLVLYHGALAPHSRWRARAVAYGREALGAVGPDAAVAGGSTAPPVPSSAPSSVGGLEARGAAHGDPVLAVAGYEACTSSAGARREPLAVPPVAHRDPGTIAGGGPPAPPAARKWSWPELMRHTFGVNVLACARCGGRMRVVATIEDPGVIRKILAHLGLPTAAPAPRPPPADLFDWS